MTYWPSPEEQRLLEARARRRRERLLNERIAQIETKSPSFAELLPVRDRPRGWRP